MERNGGIIAIKNNKLWNGNCIPTCTSEDLKQTIATHLEETKNQTTRLESMFASVGAAGLKRVIFGANQKQDEEESVDY